MKFKKLLILALIFPLVGCVQNVINNKNNPSTDSEEEVKPGDGEDKINKDQFLDNIHSVVNYSFHVSTVLSTKSYIDDKFCYNIKSINDTDYMTTQDAYKVENKSKNFYVYNLSEYLAFYHTTKEDVIARLPDAEIDEENNTLTVNSANSDSTVWCYFDDEVQQYVYLTKLGENSVDGQYLTQGAELNGQMNIFLNIIEATVLFGEFDEEKGGYYYKVDERLYEYPSMKYVLTSMFQSFDYFLLTIKDNYPYWFKIFPADDYYTSTRIDSLDYELFFRDFNKTTFTIPEYSIDCDHNLTVTSYSTSEAGHRLYCNECGKYLSNEENHSFDSEYGVCLKCGYCSQGEHEKDENFKYNGEYYATFAVNSKGKTVYANRVKASESPSFYIPDNYDNSYVLFYPSEKVLLIESYNYDDNQRIDPNSCYYVFNHCYRMYVNVDLVKDEGGNYSPANGKSWSEYLTSLTAYAVREFVSFDEKHDDYEKTEVVVDECHKIEKETCKTCGNITTTMLIKTHDAVFALTTKAEAEEIIYGSITRYAYEYNESDYVLVKETCKKCSETAIYVIRKDCIKSYQAHDYIMNATKIVVSGTKIKSEYFYDQLPHIVNDYQCSLCGSYVLQAGDYSLTVSNDEYCYFGLTKDGKEINYDINAVANAEEHTQALLFKTYSDESLVSVLLYFDDNNENIIKIELYDFSEPANHDVLDNISLKFSWDRYLL